MSGKREVDFQQSLLMNHQQLETSQGSVGDNTAVNEKVCACVCACVRACVCVCVCVKVSVLQIKPQ